MIKICEVCKIDFNVKPSHFNKRKCCSKKCQNINQKNQTGCKNNNYKGGPKILTCLYCKNNFTPKNLYAKRKFCSHECSAKETIKDQLKYVERKNKINNKTDNIKNVNTCKCGEIIKNKLKFCKNCKDEMYKHLIKKCKNCNNIFKARLKNITFCTKDCFIIYKKNNSKGVNNPNWKGGVGNENKLFRRSDEYKEWRSLVFKRDNFTCQDCKQVGGVLHAHHIKSYKDYPNLRIDVNNGLTLCYECHKKIHNWIAKPKRINA